MTEKEKIEELFNIAKTEESIISHKKSLQEKGVDPQKINEEMATLVLFHNLLKKTTDYDSFISNA